jgi:hypothetical protein
MMRLTEDGESDNDSPTDYSHLSNPAEENSMPEDSITIYRVGSQMPEEWKCPEHDRTEWNYRSGIHLVVMTYYDITRDELVDFTQGPARFAFTVEDNVIFFSYALGHTPWSDNPYSWHKLSSEEQEAGLPPEIRDEKERALINIIIVEGSTRKIAAVRQVYLSNEMTREVHQAIRCQAKRGWEDDEAHEETIERVYREYPTPVSLLKRAVATCVATARSEAEGEKA